MQARDEMPPVQAPKHTGQEVKMRIASEAELTASEEESAAQEEEREYHLCRVKENASTKLPIYPIVLGGLVNASIARQAMDAQVVQARMLRREAGAHVIVVCPELQIRPRAG